MKKQPLFSWWVVLAFLAMTVTFVLDIWSTGRETIQHEVVGPKLFSAESVRKPKLEASLNRDGFAQQCQSCHQTLDAPTVQKNFFSAHKDVILEHGENQSCQNCHSPEDKSYLIGINNKDIGFNQSEQLCFKCHGIKFRDWEMGVHGKMDLYWDKSKRVESNRPTCVACHDPHQPTFESMQASPGPHQVNYKDQALSVEGEHHHE